MKRSSFGSRRSMRICCAPLLSPGFLPRWPRSRRSMLSSPASFEAMSKPPTCVNETTSPADIAHMSASHRPRRARSAPMIGR